MYPVEELSERLKLTLVISQAEARPRSILELAEQAFAGGVTALQLREKNIPDQTLFERALELSLFCREHGRLFIINDRLDIALAVNADGLHLGQADLPAEIAAGLMPRNKILGVSASTLAQAKAALRAGADYLGVGAVFPTGSKDDAQAVTDEEINAIVGLGFPAVAIGGINAGNAAQVWSKGFAGLAVISALSQASAPEKTARQLISASRP